MSTVRKFTPEVRLKKLLAASGGVRTEDAIAGAHKALEDIRDTCLAGVDAKIEQLHACSHDEGVRNIDRCYALSNEIYAESGGFGLDELSAVAYSLCSLLAVPDRTRIPAAAIKVHIDSMRALRSPAVEGNVVMRQAVLAELKALARRFA